MTLVYQHVLSTTADVAHIFDILSSSDPFHFRPTNFEPVVGLPLLTMSTAQCAGLY